MERGFVWAGYPSILSHNHQFKKGTQSTNPNQWPDLIISSSTTGLLMEEALHPLCRFYDASTNSGEQNKEKYRNGHKFPTEGFTIPPLLVTGQLADTPTRGLPTRGLDISRTGQLVD